MAEVYEALKLGLRDYVRKNGFDRVLVAVSGGIDSALVALIAADALGPERVSCVVMPSPHSSEETQADARALVRNLGADLIEIPIEPAMHAYEELLTASGDGTGRSAGGPGPGTESARELDTGGAGTRAGGGEHPGANSRQPDDGSLEQVRLARPDHRQQERDVGRIRHPLRRHGGRLRGDQGRAEDARVPSWSGTATSSLTPSWSRESVLERAPSAELRPGQLDQDSLPPYELLDRILAAYVEEDRGRDEIVADGVPAEVVDEVIAMVDRSEYKRRQAPPGIRITPKAFGRDRRLPITNRFRG